MALRGSVSSIMCRALSTRVNIYMERDASYDGNLEWVVIEDDNWHHLFPKSQLEWWEF